MAIEIWLRRYHVVDLFDELIKIYIDLFHFNVACDMLDKKIVERCWKKIEQKKRF